VSLLFTSYLVVTAVAMLGVGWVSSRIGSKWTLILGLAIIVVFSALAGAASSIMEIVWFRGGWGLGNALFIATSLAVIVASASGGFSGAIVLYEAALGIGIAVGPLVGGLLGDISWRGPFFGVAVLMAIALVATLLFVPPIPKPAVKTKLSAPIVALRHRGLFTMGIVALLYNWGFFTMLGYAPYPMKLGALQLGYVFFGWGVLVAIFAVFLAPRLQRRFGTVPVLYVNLAVLGVIMCAIALGVQNPPVVMAAVIVSGACIGINNTLTTQAVMLVSPVERSVASSAYGFVRFIGGGLAPFVAGKIAATAWGEPGAFFVGAIAFFLAIPVLASGHKLVSAAERAQLDATDTQTVATHEPQDAAAQPAPRPVLAAINGGPTSPAIVRRGAELARDAGTSIEIVHVLETEIVEELAIAPLTRDEASATVADLIDQLEDRGLVARGTVIPVVGDRAETARVLLKHAADIDARAIVVGRRPHSVLARLTDTDVPDELRRHAHGREIVFVDLVTEQA